MKLKFTLVLFVFFMTGLTAFGQGVRFSIQMGTAIPVGDFAMKEAKPDSGGYASTGFDIRFVGERIFMNHLVVGVNLGYSVFGMDENAIKNAVNPGNPASVNIETQSFQNINIQGRVGYDFEIIEEKLGVVPCIDAGLGVFNSAYYAINDGNGFLLVRSGNTGAAFLISPGLDIWFRLNSFVNLKLYGSYQLANYSVDESFTINGQPGVIDSEPLIYKYNSINTGLGISIVF